MTTINIRLYDFVKQEFKLSDAKAREFVEVIKEEVEADIKLGNSEFKSSLKEDFLRMEVKMESLRSEIKDSKADMIKWVAAIIIGQTALLITLIKLFK